VSNENHVKTAEGLYLSEDAYISIPINEYGDLGDFGLFVKYLFNKDLDSEIARFITVCLKYPLFILSLGRFIYCGQMH
jgi:hypothetical protein